MAQYSATVSTDGTNPYEGMRKKAVDQAQGADQAGMAAIARRYASTGGQNSGAAIQSVLDQNKNTQAQTAQGLGQVDLGELQSATGQQEQQKQIEFQKGQAREVMAQKSSQFARDLPLRQRQLDLVASQQQLDKEANKMNKELGEYQNAHSGGLFGGGGTLGLGIDTGGGSNTSSSYY